jgi:hypothetical protein
MFPHKGTIARYFQAQVFSWIDHITTTKCRPKFFSNCGDFLTKSWVSGFRDTPIRRLFDISGVWDAADVASQISLKISDVLDSADTKNAMLIQTMNF